MTDTYKVLGQSLTGELALDNSTIKETIAYEVPAGTKTSVSAITITNSDIVDQTYNMAFVPNAEIESSVSNINYDVVSEITLTNTEAILIKNEYYNNGYKIWYTTNGGQGWTEKQTNRYVNKVAYAFDKYWLTTSNQIFSMNSVYSDLVQEQSFNFSPESLTYINGSLIALGTGGVGASYDGQSWTTFSLIINNTYKKPVQRGNEIVIYNSENSGELVAYSGNGGLGWNYGPATPTNFTGGIATNNEITIGVKWFNQTYYYTNANTWNWQSSSLPTWYVFDVVQAGQYFFLSSGTGLFRSTDGLTWTYSSIPAQYNYAGQRIKVVYANDMYYLINISETPSIALYSTDGISWTDLSSSITTSQAWTDVVSRTATSISSVTNTLQQSIPQSLNKHVAIYNKTISSGETHEIKGGITLSAGDQIRVYSDSAEIITNVYGVEIS